MIKTYVWNHSHIDDDFNNGICNRTRQFAEVDNNLSVSVYTKVNSIIKNALKKNMKQKTKSYLKIPAALSLIV